MLFRIIYRSLQIFFVRNFAVNHDLPDLRRIPDTTWLPGNCHLGHTQQTYVYFYLPGNSLHVSGRFSLGTFRILFDPLHLKITRLEF